MISISPITNKMEWENFLLSRSRQPFFQSWNWGELQKNLHNDILRLGIYDNRKFVGVCLAVIVNAKRGSFLHLRHGPVFVSFSKKYLDKLLYYLTQEAKKRKILFIRVSPLVEKDNKIMSILKARGMRSSAIHNMDAEMCWVLDLDKTEDELLRQMRKTTRYLIKRGEGSGLRVVRGDADDIHTFLTLYQKTARKHGFVPHRGIAEEFRIFHKDKQAELLFVKSKDKIVSGALVLFYGDQGVYHHGASDFSYEYLSPSYLLQWEAIKEAKRRGKKVYNFWGIAPDDKTNHPWAGLTLFKKGFGGRKEEFVHAQDLPLSPIYWLTYTIETSRRLLKGY